MFILLKIHVKMVETTLFRPNVQFSQFLGKDSQVAVQNFMYTLNLVSINSLQFLQYCIVFVFVCLFVWFFFFVVRS